MNPRRSAVPPWKKKFSHAFATVVDGPSKFEVPLSITGIANRSPINRMLPTVDALPCFDHRDGPVTSGNAVHLGMMCEDESAAL
jgi:hypothetical protein